MIEITYNGEPIVASNDPNKATSGQELADYLNGMQERYNHTLSEFAVPKSKFKAAGFTVSNDTVMNLDDIKTGVTAAPYESQTWDGSWRHADVSVDGDVITLSGLQRGYRYVSDDRSYEGPNGPVSLPPISRAYSPVVAGIELDYQLVPGTYVEFEFEVSMSDRSSQEFGLHMLVMDGPASAAKIPLWTQIARGQNNNTYSRYYYENFNAGYAGSLISFTDFDEIQVTPTKEIHEDYLLNESFMPTTYEGTPRVIKIGLEYTNTGLLFAHFIYSDSHQEKALMMAPPDTNSKPLTVLMLGESHPGDDEVFYNDDPAPPVFSKTITVHRNKKPANADPETVPIGSRSAIPNVHRMPKVAPDLRPTHAEIVAMTSGDEIRHMSVDDVVAIIKEVQRG